MSVLSHTGKVLYTSYPVESTTYIYNEDGESGADDGWVSAKSDHVAVQVRCGTLNATALYYRIEGRSNTYTKPCDIYSASINATQTVDTIVNIAEKVGEVRVGVYIDFSSTPNNFHAGVISAEIK